MTLGPGHHAGAPGHHAGAPAHHAAAFTFGQSAQHSEPSPVYSSAVGPGALGACCDCCAGCSLRCARRGASSRPAALGAGPRVLGPTPGRGAVSGAGAGGCCGCSRRRGRPRSERTALAQGQKLEIRGRRERATGELLRSEHPETKRSREGCDASRRARRRPPQAYSLPSAVFLAQRGLPCPAPTVKTAEPRAAARDPRWRKPRRGHKSRRS